VIRSISVTTNALTDENMSIPIVVEIPEWMHNRDCEGGLKCSKKIGMVDDSVTLDVCSEEETRRMRQQQRQRATNRLRAKFGVASFLFFGVTYFD
jgi:hypothetical protein